MQRDAVSVVVAGPPMKIGGTEQHLLLILPALAKRGFDITAVLLESGGALEPALRERLPKVVAPSFRLPRPLRTIEQARLIRAAVVRERAIVLHAFLSEPYIASAMAHATLATPRPALVFGRRSLAFYMDRHRIARRVEINSHARASALVGNSRAVVRELVEEAGEPSRVCLIPNGITMGESVSGDERAEARARFGLPPDALVLALVANLHVYKGHADLLQAVHRIRDQLPDPWRLLLVGRDGGERTKLIQSVADLGLSENIVMPGEWPGSRQPYAAADIGLLVSHTEGFSNSLIEGMAAGLPMIATRVGGNIDAIDEGQTGLLVEPRMPAGLADTILSLARSPDLRERLGRAARAKALERFSLEGCVDRYERLWRGLAEGRKGTPADWLEVELAP